MNGPAARLGLWFNDLRLQAKLLLVITVLSVVPLVLLGFLSAQTSITVLQSVSDQQVRKILEEKRRFVSSVLDEVESLIANVSSQDVLKTVLSRPLGDMSDYDSLSTQAKIGSILSGYINLKGLVSIDVLTKGGTTFHVGDTLETGGTRGPLIRKLFDAASTAETSVYWSGLEDNINVQSAYPQVINAVKRIPSRTGNPSDETLLIVSFDPHVLNQGNTVGDAGYSVIVDHQSRFVIHPEESRWGALVPVEFQRALDEGRASFSYRDASGASTVSVLPLEKAGWHLFQVTSQRTIEGATAAIALGTLSALSLSLLLLFFLGRLIARRVLVPIQQITLGFQSLQREPHSPTGALEFHSRDEIGTLTRWYNAFLQTYQQKEEAEEALLHLNRTLRDRIEAEVAANREKDSMLVHQGRQASMGEMIGNIAHQWRQPLNTVALLVQELELLALDGPLRTESVQEFAAQTLAVVDKMSTTIDDFRDFFRPNKEKVEFSAEAMTDLALTFVEPAFKHNSIEVAVERVNPGTVLGYPNELSQVLLNILNNAKDVFDERQPGRRLVRVRIETAGEAQRISIADTGGGIPAEFLPKVFDPYFTTKGPGKGTGLGLFLCKTIVERNMGGRITARNIELEPGFPGAEFIVEIGTVRAPGPPDRPQGRR